VTPQEVMDIMKTASLTDVTYLKWGDLELHRGDLKEKIAYPLVESDPAHAAVVQSESKITPPNPPEQKLSPEEEKEIKHKVEEMTSLMKIGDNDLIDRLFPLPPDPEGTEE
jgi:hypothetical protein